MTRDLVQNVRASKLPERKVDLSEGKRKVVPNGWSRNDLMMTLRQGYMEKYQALICGRRREKVMGGRLMRWIRRLEKGEGGPIEKFVKQFMKICMARERKKEQKK
jgi:hypothetical protein